MRILITGASGFIGSFLVEMALAEGYETWAGIRQTSNCQFLQDSRIRFIDLNFGNKNILEKQLQEFSGKFGKFDYIIHNAGVTKTLNNADFEKVNYLYTRNFIESLIQTDNIPRKFVFMSSLSAYGVGDEIGYTPFSLLDKPRPNTAYGKSKLKAEQFLQSTDNFPYVILRPTGVYGPREKDYLVMLKTVNSGLGISAGFKSQHLTFIYVKDLVNAVFLALKSSLTNKAYFVADGDVYTNEEYSELIKILLNKKFVINLKIPLWLLRIISIISEELSRITKKTSTLNRDKYKIMRQRNWECDITPIANELGFRPEYNLHEGLKESIEWYRKNKWL